MIIKSKKIKDVVFLKNISFKDNRGYFKELLKESFSVNIFKLIGISLLLNLIVWILFIAAMASAALSGILAFLLFLVVWAANQPLLFLCNYKSLLENSETLDLKANGKATTISDYYIIVSATNCCFALLLLITTSNDVTSC